MKQKYNILFLLGNFSGKIILIILFRSKEEKRRAFPIRPYFITLLENLGNLGTTQKHP